MSPILWLVSKHLYRNITALHVSSVLMSANVASVFLAAADFVHREHRSASVTLIFFCVYSVGRAKKNAPKQIPVGSWLLGPLWQWLWWWEWLLWSRAAIQRLHMYSVSSVSSLCVCLCFEPNGLCSKNPGGSARSQWSSSSLCPSLFATQT